MTTGQAVVHVLVVLAVPLDVTVVAAQKPSSAANSRSLTKSSSVMPWRA
jgi:hypothetical protein